MISKKLLTFLDKNNISYEAREHRKVFTAYDTAATLHIPLEMVIKALCVNTKKGFLFVLVPANRRVDLKKIATLCGVPKVSLPTEKEIAKKLTTTTRNAPLMPLGFFYSCETLIEKSLLSLKKAYLGSGDFKYSLIIKPKALTVIDGIRTGSFCLPGKQKLVVPKPPKKRKAPPVKKIKRKPVKTPKKKTKR